MDESEAGCAAERGNGGLGDAVHALGGSGDGLVGGVCGGEVAGQVLAAIPGETDPGGLGSVAVLDSAALAAEEFVSGEAGGVLVREPHPVHLSRDLQAAAAV